MKTLLLPCVTLPAINVPGPLISAHRLSDIETAGSIIDEAHQQADLIRLEADEYYRDVMNQCESIREQAFQEGFDAFQDELPFLREQVSLEIVDWLAEEHQLEEAVISRLFDRMLEILVDVCSTFFTDANSEELLTQQLKKHFSLLPSEQNATLYVSDEQYSVLSSNFTPETWLTVKIDPHLHSDIALLDTSLCSLRIDLSEQRDSVLARLGSLKEENEFTYEN